MGHMEFDKSRRNFLENTCRLGAAGLILKTFGREDVGKTLHKTPLEATTLDLQNLQHRLIIGGLAHDTEEFPSSVENFPWTKDEVLFGPHAGFQNIIKSGEAIKVYMPSELRDVSPEALAGWNAMGMDLIGRPYFELIAAREVADVRFVAADGETWVHPLGGFTVPFTTVDINVDVRVNGQRVNNFRAAHELGHALGLVDWWATSEQYEKAKKDPARYKNPQNGADPHKPYTGIMNYADTYNPERWYGKDDKKLLQLAGYGK